MPSNLDLVTAARGWIGTRWVHQGRSRHGVDCVGLLLVTLAELGIEAADMQGYRRSGDPETFVNHVYSQTVPVELSDLAPGHIGVFRDGTQPCHVGIFAEKYEQPSLIHAYAGIGCVLEEPFIHDWPRRLVAVRAMQELG